MTSPPASVPDVAEQLMREFESVLPTSVVTDTVMRVSRNGTATLPVVAEMARHELARIAAGIGGHGPSASAESSGDRPVTSEAGWSGSAS